ncbi:tRNA (N6-threonylcarbamoyladenosine(37)-N6)-methyltransferase TrmO [candidate division WOR-3 bacterium]|nr:tRNA (N6-threonylcarbamoyladenosine(37)-N6)-methyltransferase TrmO [candidate division WOR-3 bacterium]
MRKSLEFTTIGLVHSPYSKPGEIHPLKSRFAKGTIEVFEHFEKGLKDIDGFSHIYVIWWSHLVRGYDLLTTPIMRPRPKRGMFATRIPARPNPICLTVLRLIEKEGRYLKVKGVDMVDRTPVLDIKPYTSRDIRSHLSIGWLDEVERSNQ